ncbi:PHB depolymerase family esterase [Isoptericola sp. NPDC019482]|uniref:alpha/beta hydrolase family esterase n=1 Tax=Isoptericola sp. NPDC019482 TaxID=3154688 RepID=UPI003483A75E
MPPRLRAVTLALVAGSLLAACTGPTDDDPPADPVPPATAPAHDETLTVDGRPFALAVPPGHDPAEAAPLLVVLHGYGDEAAEVDARLGLRDGAARRGVLYALPEGTPDASGRKFWDATDACCGWDGPDVDDSSYLADVVRTVGDAYAVDPDRVAVVGHSNGGFMAYRLACDHADLVRLVVSLAGAMPADAGACAPTRPVSAVQVHGTADPVVRYEGGRIRADDYASAPASAADWARLDGCDSEPDVSAGALDLDVDIPGAETSVSSFPGCSSASRVELWAVDGAGHSPTLGDEFSSAVLDAVVGTDGPAPR